MAVTTEGWEHLLEHKYQGDDHQHHHTPVLGGDNHQHHIPNTSGIIMVFPLISRQGSPQLHQNTTR